MPEYMANCTQMMKTWGLVSYKDFREARCEPAPGAMIEKNILLLKKPYELISVQDT